MIEVSDSASARDEEEISNNKLLPLTKCVQGHHEQKHQGQVADKGVCTVNALPLKKEKAYQYQYMCPRHLFHLLAK